MTRTTHLSETLAETDPGLTARNMARNRARNMARAATILPRRRRLLAGLTAGVLSVAVITASALPARADRNDDIAKALAAIAVLGIIAHAVNKDKDRDRDRDADRHVRSNQDHDGDGRPDEDGRMDENDNTYPRYSHGPHPYPPHRPRYDEPRQSPRGDLDPRHAPRVPEVCAIRIEGDRREVTVYAGRCLRDEGFRYDLPEYCARGIRIYGQRDRIYSADCLRDAGFRVGPERHHTPERPD